MMIPALEVGVCSTFRGSGPRARRAQLPPPDLELGLGGPGPIVEPGRDAEHPSSPDRLRSFATPRLRRCPGCRSLARFCPLGPWESRAARWPSRAPARADLDTTTTRSPGLLMRTASRPPLFGRLDACVERQLDGPRRQRASRTRRRTSASTARRAARCPRRGRPSAGVFIASAIHRCRCRRCRCGRSRCRDRARGYPRRGFPC